MRERTTSIHSQSCPVRSPLPTVAKGSGVESNLTSRPSTSAPVPISRRDRVGAPAIGGGVRGLLAEAATRIR